MYKLLFIDDESIYKLTIRGLVDWEKYGFLFAGTASNGAEAIAFLRHTKVDGIITDLEMPVMDGVTLIKKLREGGFAGPILALSNYSDYDRVRGALTAGAFDYLIKIEMTPAQMIAALKKMAQQCDRLQSSTQDNGTSVPEGQMFPLMKNYLLDTTADEPPKGLRNLIPKDCFPITVSAVKVFKQIPGGSTMATFLETAIRECFKEIVPLFVLPLHGNELLFLLPNESVRRAGVNLSARMKILSRQVNAFLSAKPVLSYTTGAMSLAEVKTAYQSCAASYQRIFYSDCESVVQLPGSYDTLDFLPIRDSFISAAIASLKSTNRVEFSVIIRDFIQTCQQHQVSPPLLKDSFTVLAWCCRDLGLLSVTSDEFRDIIHYIESSPDSDHLAQTLNMFFCTHSDSAHNSSAPVRQEIAGALLFVNQNYGNKIALEDVANHVGLTREYLSRLFLKETGVNLFQYIMDVRMRKAAELLTGETSLLIKEVALAVGFDNQYSFSRKFKEYYGVSPISYKDSLSAQGDAYMQSR